VLVVLWLALALADTVANVSADEMADQIQAHPGVRLVHVWATWCGPCVKEFDGLGALTKELSRRGLQVFGVSVDRNAGATRAFLSEHPTGWTHLRVTDGSLGGAIKSLGGRYGGGIPYNLLLDTDGSVLASWSGASSPKAIRARIEPHLSSGVAWTGPSAAQLEAMTQGMLVVTLEGRDGDPVFIDNWNAGPLPLQSEVIGGLHDVRIEGEAGTVRLDQFLVEFDDSGRSVLDVGALTQQEPAQTAPAE
jgi:peroxiredoxin